MSTSSRASASETAIFGRVLAARPNFPVAAAKALIDLDFSDEDKERARVLSAKAQEGTLSTAERDELENYVRVDHMLGSLRSKARLSLKNRASKAR